MLVDAAAVGPENLAAICMRYDWVAHSAYEGTQLAGFAEYSPHLIALSDDPHRRRLQLKMTLCETREATAVSWFASAAALSAIQGLFGYLAKLKVQGREKPLHCRVADLRTLEPLIKALNSQQHQRVAQVLSRWHWFDRYGELQGWPQPSDADVEADTSIYLQLTAAAYQVLNGDSEADKHFCALMKIYPDYVPDQQRGDFHRHLNACLDTATQLQITHADDRLQFLVLCLKYGDDFHQLPGLTNTWSTLSQSETRLMTLMLEWPASLQAALAARRLNA
jgi:hypothetical protein